MHATKKIKVAGIIFVIKKIDPLDHLQGIKALQNVFQLYKVEKDKKKTVDDSIDAVKNIQKWMRDILLAGVVSPKLSAKADGSGFHVDEVLKDIELSKKLATTIISFTYKKKIN